MATIRTTLALGTIAGICCDELRVAYKTRPRPIERLGVFGIYAESYTELVSVELDGPIKDEDGKPVTITNEQRNAILAAAERKIEEWI